VTVAHNYATKHKSETIECKYTIAIVMRSVQYHLSVILLQNAQEIFFSNFEVSDPVEQVIFEKPHAVRKSKYLHLLTA